MHSCTVQTGLGRYAACVLFFGFLLFLCLSVSHSHTRTAHSFLMGVERGGNSEFRLLPGPLFSAAPTLETAGFSYTKQISW